MSGSLEALILASVLFVASHVVLPAAPVRAALVGAAGETAYMIVYSVLSVAFLAWMIIAYKAAPYVEMFIPNTAMRHASLTLMLIAAFLLVGGLTGRNPGTVQARYLGWRPQAGGVLKITRHPVMWAVALWGISHILANGHAAALVFFGAMVVLALAGAAHIDRRKRTQTEEEWAAFEAETSFVPLMAIAAGKTRVEKGEIPWWQTLAAIGVYAAMLVGHDMMGRNVFPFSLFS